MLFTDAEQSCTAGSFIIAQSVYHTGQSKVGMPGADIGLCADDPAIAELLKPHRMRPASSARTTSAT